jgi:hypothetical protein
MLVVVEPGRNATLVLCLKLQLTLLQWCDFNQRYKHRARQTQFSAELTYAFTAYHK